MAEYLTNDTDLKKVADAIRVKSGTSAPLVYPSEFVSTIQSIDITGGTKSATLTITSSDYTGNRFARFIFPTLEGHIESYDHLSTPFTFPVTVKTVIGGLVVISPSNFGGIPGWRNVIGSEVFKNQNQFIILVTSPQASIDIYDSDA